jgi:hypothetical protein
MPLSTLANCVLLFLFVLAFAAALRVAWMRTKTSPRLICVFFAFVALAIVDATLIVTQTQPPL